MGPPTCGTMPVTMGQTCMSVMRAAGGKSFDSLKRTLVPAARNLRLRSLNKHTAKIGCATVGRAKARRLHLASLGAIVGLVGILRGLGAGGAGAAAGAGGATAVD